MFRLKLNFKSYNYKASRLVRKIDFGAFLEKLKDQRSLQTFLDLKKLLFKAIQFMCRK